METGTHVTPLRTSVWNRISVSETAGILTGYHVIVNLETAFLAATFLATIKAEPMHLPQIRDALIG